MSAPIGLAHRDAAIRRAGGRMDESKAGDAIAGMTGLAS
jgi:hypothetical protein